MRFRRAAPATLIVAVGVVVVASAAASLRLFSGLTDSVEQSQFDSMEKILAFNLRGAEQKALARAEMISDLPRVRDLMSAQDRPGLLVELGPLFQTQHEKYGVDQIQFVVPPATSLLRLQAPDKFGDDLSGTRPMIVAVTQDKAARTGATIAKTGPALGAVVPMTDNSGAYIGVLEVGMGIGPVLDGLKGAYGLESTFYVEEKPMREVATSAPGEAFDKQNQVGRYLKYHATNWGLMRQLADGSDLAKVDQPVRYVRSIDGRPYGVVLIPVKSGTGASFGVIAVAKDFSATRAAAGRSVVWQGLIAVLGVLLLAGVIIVVLRGFLLSPLAAINRKLGEVARGEDSSPIEDADGYCAELQELAAHHEALRTKDDAK